MANYNHVSACTAFVFKRGVIAPNCFARTVFAPKWFAHAIFLPYFPVSSNCPHPSWQVCFVGYKKNWSRLLVYWRGTYCDNHTSRLSHLRTFSSHFTIIICGKLLSSFFSLILKPEILQKVSFLHS